MSSPHWTNVKLPRTNAKPLLMTFWWRFCAVILISCREDASKLYEETLPWKQQLRMLWYAPWTCCCTLLYSIHGRWLQAKVETYLFLVKAFYHCWQTQGLQYSTWNRGFEKWKTNDLQRVKQNYQINTSSHVWGSVQLKDLRKFGLGFQLIKISSFKFFTS